MILKLAVKYQNNCHFIRFPKVSCGSYAAPDCMWVNSALLWSGNKIILS